MRFLSDNTASVSPEILAALAAVNHGRVNPYGDDEWSARLDRAFSDYFGTAVKLAQTLPTVVPDREVVLTQPLVSDQQVQSFLLRRGLTCALCDVALDVPIYGVTVAPKAEPQRVRQRRSPTALTPH